jgi:hypothetical protein
MTALLQVSMLFHAFDKCAREWMSDDNLKQDVKAVNANCVLAAKTEKKGS